MMVVKRGKRMTVRGLPYHPFSMALTLQDVGRRWDEEKEKQRDDHTKLFD